MSNRVTTRGATLNDVRAFYPDMTASFRAWIVELDGEVQGIIGIALVRPMPCIFSVFKEALRPFLRSLPIMRLVKKLQAIVEASKGPVLAIAEPKEVTAPSLLMKLGFRYYDTIDGDEIYAWGAI